MRNRLIVPLAVVGLGVIALLALDQDPTSLDEAPCSVLPIDVAARAIGASTWDRAERRADDQGPYCDYFVSSEPALTLRATDSRRQDPPSEPSEQGSLVCGAEVWRQGETVVVRGERWTLQVRTWPETHGQTEVDDDLVRILAREVATSTQDLPGPVTLDFDGSC